MFWLHNPYRPLLVKERGWVDRTLGRAAFAIDLVKGPAEVFGPLKAILESISVVYAQYQVRFGPPFAPFAPLTDNYVYRTLLPLRTRLKYFAHASPCWRNFLGSPRVTRRKENFVKDCRCMQVVLVRTGYCLYPP